MLVIGSDTIVSSFLPVSSRFLLALTTSQWIFMYSNPRFTLTLLSILVVVFGLNARLSSLKPNRFDNLLVMLIAAEAFVVILHLPSYVVA